MNLSLQNTISIAALLAAWGLVSTSAIAEERAEHLAPQPFSELRALRASAPAPDTVNSVAQTSRDGRCAIVADATSICSLASGRMNMFVCAHDGLPPKPVPSCMSMGSRKHWCCF